MSTPAVQDFGPPVSDLELHSLGLQNPVFDQLGSGLEREVEMNSGKIDL